MISVTDLINQLHYITLPVYKMVTFFATGDTIECDLRSEPAEYIIIIIGIYIALYHALLKALLHKTNVKKKNDRI